MFKFIKQLFCRHDFIDEYISIGYHIRNGVEYLPYLRTCKKCWKQKLIIKKGVSKMPDKKLTDSEIIKALECCHENSDCGDCMFALHRTHDGTCVDMLHTNALDLINRLQAENERLSKKNIALNRCAIPSSGTILKVGNALLFAEKEEDYATTINTIKAEAYKEFAEEIENINLSNSDDYFEFKRSRFDNLLKELVGDSE